MRASPMTGFSDPAALAAAGLAGYARDPATGVWSREGSAPLAYTDGADAERALLETMRAATDRSVFSAELAASIRDWVGEYHLSAQRSNLLRPFAFGPGTAILELGAGCGALTRFLGETGAFVVAVEGSPLRAQVAAARCADLPNVCVVADTIEGFTASRRFDAVLLIGVLEYAPAFGGGADPVGAQLARARACVDDGGALVVAIENQLGLKYFAGCAEDHVGAPFAGICDRYAPHGPVTFGRHELDLRLAAAGFARRDYLLPFPDYKLPSAILAPAAAAHPELRVGDLLVRAVSRDYRNARERTFLETLAWSAIARNGLLADLANSFLVIAAAGAAAPAWAPPASVLAWTWSHPRRPPFIAASEFTERGEGLHIVRRALLPGSAAEEPAAEFRHRPAGSQYQPGALLLTRLLRDAESFRQAELDAGFLRWIDFLLVCSGTPTQPDDIDASAITLPPEFVDAIPGNAIERGDGTLTLFDLEWVADRRVPFAWIVLRGIAHTLQLTVDWHRKAPQSVFELARRLLATTHVRLAADDWVQAVDWERRLLRFAVYGERDLPANLWIERAMLPPAGAYVGVMPR